MLHQNTAFGTSLQSCVEDYREILNRDVTLFEEIGRGSSGVVRKARWKGDLVAVKYVEHLKGELDTEVSHLCRLEHMNIVIFHGVIKQKLDVGLVMELAEVGSLHNLLHCTPCINYTAGHAISWAKQCADGAAYLHDNKLVHRDLKPANLLLFKGGTLLKIGDFGTVTLRKTEMSNARGSPQWMAPEVFAGNAYTEKCDVYSIGIILWELTSRQRPFKNTFEYRILFSVALEDNRPPSIEGCFELMDTLMTDCWNGKATERPYMREVAKSLQLLSKDYSGEDIPIVISLQDEYNTTAIKTHASEYPKCYIQAPNIESVRTESYRLQTYEPTADMQIIWNSNPVRENSHTEIEQQNVEDGIRFQPFAQINNVDIKKRQIICKGSFGVWYKATWKYKTVAVKYFNNLNEESARNSFYTKVQQLSLLQHPYIVMFLGAFTEKSHAGIVLEFGENGTLHNLLHKSKVQLCFDRSINWAHQCAQGVAYFHNMRPKPLIHRDLQPSHLMLFQGNTVLKIAGFGMVTELKTTMTNQMGSARWMAPVYQNNTYNEKCDIFSFGVLLWEIFFRELPFKEKNSDHAIMTWVAQGNRPEISLKFKRRYPPLEKLMNKCWHANPATRPMMHNVINRINIKYLVKKGDVP